MLLAVEAMLLKARKKVVAQKELVWLLHRRIKVMRALHRVPVRAAARSVWRGRMIWSKLYCVE